MSLRFISSMLGVEVAAVAVGLGLTLMLLSPSGSDVVEIGAYLATSAFVSIVAVEMLLRTGLLARRTRLKFKISLAVSIGAGLGFLNAFVMSALMFVNTWHDLPMLLAVLVFAAVIAGYASVRTSSNISESMTSLASRARELSAGDLSVRMPVEHQDPETFEVVSAFNEMAANLEAAAREKERVDQSRKELSAAISHDLRTPISSARVMLEAIRDGVTETPEEQNDYLERILMQVKSLGSLVDDLFALSLLDAGELKLDLEPTVVDDLVEETLRSMQSTASGKGLKLDSSVGESLGNAVMDSKQVRRVLLNLVQNAIRHTPPDGTVTIAAIRQDDRIEFEVRDTGEGFDLADSSNIWKRFFRSDRARTRTDDESAQSGLGLAIARGIVELHGGEISASSAVSSGATFRFWIPDGHRPAVSVA